MFRIVVALSCVIFFVGTSGASLDLPPLLNENVVELTQLMEQFWSLKPTAVQNHRPLAICQFIDNCCKSEDRLKAIPLMVSLYRDQNFTFPKVIKTCTYSTELNKADQFCPSLEKFISIPLNKNSYDPVVRQFSHIWQKNTNDKTKISKLMRLMRESCDSYEYYTFICLSDKKALKACIGEAIQVIYYHGGNNVYNYLRETKQSLLNINQQLVQLSLKNANIN